MGHKFNYADDMFSSVYFNKKTSEEVRVAMARKLAEVRALSATREVRIMKLREEYEIDAELLAQLVMQFHRNKDEHVTNYNNQPGKAIIPAGVIANIIREQEMIDNERKQVRKMELVLRNLRDTELYHTEDTGETKERACIHFLSDAELEYLGF